LNYSFKVPPTALFDVEKAKELFSNDIRVYLNTVLPITQTNIKQEAPVGVTSQLRNTIYTEVKETEGRVYSGVDYAVVVNEGRAAGKTPPPPDALINWIRLSAGGRAWFAAIRSKYPNMTVKAASFILARSIGKKGFKNDFFDRGIKKSKNYIKVEAGRLLKKIAEGLCK